METSFDECPECGEDITEMMRNHDPLGEGERTDVECDNCGKIIMVSATYSVNYDAWKVPCLNDGEHDWQPITGIPEEYFKNKERCSHCLKEQIKKFA